MSAPERRGGWFELVRAGVAYICWRESTRDALLFFYAREKMEQWYSERVRRISLLVVID